MKIVGATEYAVVLYRDKLPKFNNGAQRDENGKTISGTGKMVFDWFRGRNVTVQKNIRKSTLHRSLLMSSSV